MSGERMIQAVIGYDAGGRDRHSFRPDDFGMEFAWLEGIDGIVLEWFSKVRDGWAVTAEWPAGRLFGPRGEYRWRFAAGRKIHSVLLLDEEPHLPSNYEGQISLTAEPERDSALILWGEWVDQEKDEQGNPDRGTLFYANEIPGVQTYPLQADLDALTSAAREQKTPRMLVRRYTPADPAEHAAGEFVRCVGFDLRTEI